MPPLRRLTVILILLLFPALTLASGFSESVTALRGTSSTPLPDAINAVATAFLVLTTTLALIVIVLAGVQYMLSQGDEEKVETAKKTLVGAVMGLLVIGLSGAGVNCVLNMINGRGCGGGGTTTTSVAVRTGGGGTLRTLALPDDGEFSGGLPGDGEEESEPGANEICKPCEASCLYDLAGLKNVCSQQWTPERVPGRNPGVTIEQCVCKTPEKIDGLTEDACANLGSKKQRCTGSKYFLLDQHIYGTPDAPGKCISKEIPSILIGDAFLSHGQCKGLQPQPIPPRPVPDNSPVGNICSCQCGQIGTDKILCRIPLEPTKCTAAVNNKFDVRVRTATAATCATLDGKACQAYSSSKRDSLEQGERRNCAPKVNKDGSPARG